MPSRSPVLPSHDSTRQARITNLKSGRERRIPGAIKRSASRDTGLSEDGVVVYPQRMGGGFGGREYYEVERDAVRLARAVKRPVKVQWIA